MRAERLDHDLRWRDMMLYVRDMRRDGQSVPWKTIAYIVPRREFRVLNPRFPRIRT